MADLIHSMIAAPFIVIAVSAVLIFLFAVFVAIFCVRAMHSIFSLSQISTKLKGIKGGRKDQALEAIFADDDTFSHLWKEYKDTLHRQQEFDDEGKPKPVVLRSTIPAAMVFTTEIIVDTPLKTEFFKHLPGIFTGTGIIGTFWGLIQGLQSFRISDDPFVVRTSLELLMRHVSSAFIVSATAILLAMIATFVEKSLVTILYGKIEWVTSRLDTFFQSGASEEYLARLTKASEETSDQSKILKDALVEDLERILTKITDNQIEKQNAGMMALGRHLSDGIKQS